MNNRQTIENSYIYRERVNEKRKKTNQLEKVLLATMI